MMALRPEERDEILNILKKLIPDCDVCAFGSRTTSHAKPFSDLDLAIMSQQPLPLALMADLREAFSESNLPFRVDLVDWAATDEKFRFAIKSQLVELYRPQQSHNLP